MSIKYNFVLISDHELKIVNKYVGEWLLRPSFNATGYLLLKIITTLGI